MTKYTTTPAQKVQVYQIAAKMKSAGLSDEFVSDAVALATEYEGAYDLMVLWSEESEQEAQGEIVADIQEEIDERLASPKRPTQKPYINLDDLDAIAANIVEFKAVLRVIVDKQGGISDLSRKSGIPQPSLSRFFSSASMPRRTTLYRIGLALGIDQGSIATKWAA